MFTRKFEGPRQNGFTDSAMRSTLANAGPALLDCASEDRLVWEASWSSVV
jgi:hypothetical protein